MNDLEIGQNIANVNNLEKTVNSLESKYKENISIFITGFNSDLIL